MMDEQPETDVFVELRSLDEEKREVVGYAVPWGELLDLGGVKETFTRGSITDFDVPLYLEHKEAVGTVIEGVDTDEGYAIRARISNTAKGNDVIQLIKDKALRAFSIGFSPLETDTSAGLLNRTKIKLREVTLTGAPLYEGAKILAYRSGSATSSQNEEITKEEVHMEETDTVLADEVKNLREDVLELQRSAVVEPKPTLEFRSFGEYVKAVAHGDERAETLFRAYTGGTSADSVFHDGWVGDKSRIISKPRRVLNAFNTAPLPAEGMNVEFAVIDTNTIAVAEQAAEGDDLTLGQISVTTATSPVKTYGGYTLMTRQEIDRASVNILDKAFTAMAAAYANVTNGVVRTAVAGASLPTIAGGALASMDGADWLGVAVDAASALDTYNYNLDALVVSGDVFKGIATLTDTSGRPLLWTNNPSNNIGSVAGLSASLAGIPVIVDPGAAALTAWAVTSEAATTYESPGAPLRLQDSDVVNLSGAFSVYGYMAFAIHDVNGIVKVVLT